jgi:hypothetical protein
MEGAEKSKKKQPIDALVKKRKGTSASKAKKPKIPKKDDDAEESSNKLAWLQHFYAIEPFDKAVVPKKVYDSGPIPTSVRRCIAHQFSEKDGHPNQRKRRFQLL